MMDHNETSEGLGKKPARLKRKSKRKPSNIFINIFLFLIALVCILPLLSIISISFSNNADLTQFGFSIIPRHLDLTAYRYIFNDPTLIISGYEVSILVTALGTFVSLFVTTAIAYVLSRHDYKFHGVISFFVFFTLIFNGGLVPWYMLINNYLHLGNTIWALILPYAANAWFILLLRTFFQKLPFEIIESCYMDGAGDFRIFFQIVLPLSLPGIATIGLLIMLTYWNDWWLALLFIEKTSLFPLQKTLYSMLSNIQFLTSSTAIPSFLKVTNLPTENARMAMALLAAGPMLFVFPFFQKYFVRGLTVGAVKG